MTYKSIMTRMKSARSVAQRSRIMDEYNKWLETASFNQIGSVLDDMQIGIKSRMEATNA